MLKSLLAWAYCAQKRVKSGIGMKNAPEGLYFQGKEEHNAYF